MTRGWAGWEGGAFVSRRSHSCGCRLPGLGGLGPALSPLPASVFNGLMSHGCGGHVSQVADFPQLWLEQRTLCCCHMSITFLAQAGPLLNWQVPGMLLLAFMPMPCICPSRETLKSINSIFFLPHHSLNSAAHPVWVRRHLAERVRPLGVPQFIKQTSKPPNSGQSLDGGDLGVHSCDCFSS